jgi:hypothetical protein
MRQALIAQWLALWANEGKVAGSNPGLASGVQYNVTSRP